ncbi:MAG: EVE domain-containing protein [Dehalococcoidia bacterium]
MLQANPKTFNLNRALQAYKEVTWLVQAHASRIKPGDTAFIWRSGPEGGIVAVAEVLTVPQEFPANPPAHKGFYRDPTKFEGLRQRVRIRITDVLDEPIYRKDLKTHPLLSDLAILSSPEGTNRAVTERQASALEEELRSRLGSAWRLPSSAAADYDTPEFSEGRLAERKHQTRERNDRVAVAKKRDVLGRGGCLGCEVCGFDFPSAYGTLGAGSEVHHLVPVSAWPPGERKTRLEDLAVVCSNCHRMLHHMKPWPSVADLKHQMRHVSRRGA